MTTRPFGAFNFNVRVALGDAEDPLCEAAFSECSGLESTVGVKTIRAGGHNAGPIHLAGPVSYANLSLKRGMTTSFDLWRWFDQVLIDGERHRRATCEVEVLATDRSTAVFTVTLGRCLPVKLRAPTLNATDGQVAIEEMEIAYEVLTLRPAGGEVASRA